MIVPWAVINRHSTVRYGLSFSLGIDHLSSSDWGFNQCLKKEKNGFFKPEGVSTLISHIDIHLFDRRFRSRDWGISTSIGIMTHAMRDFNLARSSNMYMFHLALSALVYSSQQAVCSGVCGRTHRPLRCHLVKLATQIRVKSSYIYKTRLRVIYALCAIRVVIYVCRAVYAVIYV